MTGLASDRQAPRPSRLRAALALELALALPFIACHGGQAVTGGRRAAGPPEPAPTGAGDASPPEVDGRPAVVAHYGQRVRLRGRYESRPLADVRGRVWTHGPFLILDDGALILLEPRERPAAEIAAHEGRSVEITGVLVAPPVPSFDVPSVNVESLRPRE